MWAEQARPGGRSQVPRVAQGLGESWTCLEKWVMKKEGSTLRKSLSGLTVHLCSLPCSVRGGMVNIDRYQPTVPCHRCTVWSVGGRTRSRSSSGKMMYSAIKRVTVGVTQLILSSSTGTYLKITLRISGRALGSIPSIGVRVLLYLQRTL